MGRKRGDRVPKSLRPYKVPGLRAHLVAYHQRAIALAEEMAEMYPLGSPAQAEDERQLAVLQSGGVLVCRRYLLGANHFPDAKPEWPSHITEFTLHEDDLCKPIDTQEEES